MRPTVIRLIVGGALGIAFSVSLMLPGALMLPEQPPIRHLATPDAPSTMIVRVAPVAAPKRAPAPRRVVVRPVYVPAVRTAPAATVVRHAPSRSRPSPKPVTRTSPPAQQRLTPLAAPPSPAEREQPKKPTKAKRPGEEKKEKKEKKEKGDDGEERERERGGHDDEGDDEGGGRGDDSVEG
jgi:hypothetical protein